MLQAIHDNLKGVFAMVILGVLAVVFIFWGVEFVSVGGLTSTKGISVNGEDIGVAEVRQEFQDRITQFQASMPGVDLPAELREQIRPYEVHKGETDRVYYEALENIVRSVEDNGDLIVSGEQLIKVNDEKQEIVLSGRVRPIDISENNTVVSSRLADARISYVGDGVLGEKQRPGILTRILSWLRII